MPNHIDLTKADSQYTKRLFEFFDTQSKLGLKLWKRNKTYAFADGTEFTLQHDMFQRDRKEGHEGVRYELVSNTKPLGKGSYGHIFKIEATVVLEEGLYRCKKFGEKGKARIVKVQNHTLQKNPVNELKLEYELTKRLSHLAIKTPTIIPTSPNTHASFTVMKNISGRDLWYIISDDLYKKHVLSTQQRLELSQALLFALKEQVIGKKLVHRDIKPENIMIDLGPPLRVNIIDYGFSFEEGHSDGRSKGTPFYAAPEISNSPFKVNHKADVFSLGRVIAEIWHVDRLTYDKADVYQRATNNQLIANLFFDIKDIDEQTKNRVRSTLLGMLQKEPENRFSLDEAIACFCSSEKEEAKTLPFTPCPAIYSSRITFFSYKKSEAKTQVSCFLPAELKEIQDLIDQLTKEVDSWWPFYNKVLKSRQIYALKELIDYSMETNDPDDALSRVKYLDEYTDLRNSAGSKVGILLAKLVAHYNSSTICNPG